MYTIKRASELTGVPTATLRAWERRYAVVTPARTSGGYRLYDDRALDALRAMRALVDDGWTPSQAAAETLRRGAAGSVAGSVDGRVDGRVDGGTDAATAPAPPAGAEGELPAAVRLLDAAKALDVQAVEAILDDQFSRASFEVVVDDWLMPALAAVGASWESGSLPVSGEHLVAYAVQRRLASAYTAAARVNHGPGVVIGLPPGARHELGLLAFATAARRLGLATTYIGADLPVRDWTRVGSRFGATCLVLAVTRADELGPLRRVVTAVTREEPELLIAVGGQLQDRAPRACERLGHRIGDASVRLAGLLSSTGHGTWRA